MALVCEASVRGVRGAFLAASSRQFHCDVKQWPPGYSLSLMLPLPAGTTAQVRLVSALTATVQGRRAAILCAWCARARGHTGYSLFAAVLAIRLQLITVFNYNCHHLQAARGRRVAVPRAWCARARGCTGTSWCAAVWAPWL